MIPSCEEVPPKLQGPARGHGQQMVELGQQWAGACAPPLTCRAPAHPASRSGLRKRLPTFGTETGHFLESVCPHVLREAWWVIFKDDADGWAGKASL